MYVSDAKLWILWVVIVPLGPLLGWLLQRIWGNLSIDWQRAMLFFFVFSLGEGFLTLFTRWSLRGFWPQAINSAVAYTSSICLLAVALKKRKKSAGVMALRSFAVLVLLLLCYGLANVSLETDIPDSEAKIGDHLIIRRASGGWAGIDWEDVTIVQQPRYLPFLEKKLISTHIGDAGDCDGTSVHVTQKPSSNEILIRCGSDDFVYGRVRMP